MRGRRALVTAAVLLLGAPAAGQDPARLAEEMRDQRDAARREMREQIEDAREAMRRGVADARQARERDIEAAQRAQRRDIRAAFEAYRVHAARLWGAREAQVPGLRTVVEYRAQGTQRRVVDLERGEAEVGVLLSAEEAADPALVRARLQQAVEWAVTGPPDDRSMLEIAEAPEAGPGPGDGEPLLAGQVVDASGRVVGAAEAAAFAAEQARNALPQRSLTGQDGIRRVLVSARFGLAEDHMRQRARRYAELVRGESARHEIPAPLVFAVIETESSYNPLARSPIPAFGLMQIVPASAGRDAYEFLYGEDRLLSDRYLYDPANNVELGAAYLHKVYYHYMRGIQNDRARLWCSVAAYNTGPGNVFRTFAGRYTRAGFGSRSKWRAAARAEINGMDGEEVFDTLRRKLPYRETRRYMEKIRDRMPKYEELAVSGRVDVSTPRRWAGRVDGRGASEFNRCAGREARGGRSTRWHPSSPGSSRDSCPAASSGRTTGPWPSSPSTP